MVKVAGPMLSLDASGTLAGAMVFSKWKGRPYVRSHVVPSNPKSGAQVGVRAMFKFLSQKWGALTAGNKATWEATAEQLAISPFNAFLSKNQFRWRNFLTPSKVSPAAEIEAAPSAPTAVATAGVRQISLAITKGATAPTWGYMIFRSPTGTFTPVFSNAIAVVAIDGSGNGSYVDTPLAAGTYYYEIRGFTADGIAGPSSAEYSAVVV
jgi:hypothetical protein